MASAAYPTISSDIEVLWGDPVKCIDEGVAIISCIVAHKTVQFPDKIVLANDVKNNLSLRSACMITEKRPKGNKEVALVMESVWQRC